MARSSGARRWAVSAGTIPCSMVRPARRARSSDAVGTRALRPEVHGLVDDAHLAAVEPGGVARGPVARGEPPLDLVQRAEQGLDGIGAIAPGGERVLGRARHTGRFLRAPRPAQAVRRPAASSARRASAARRRIMSAAPWAGARARGVADWCDPPMVAGRAARVRAGGMRLPHPPPGDPALTGRATRRPRPARGGESEPAQEDVMKPNVGSLDQVVRIVVGLVLVAPGLRGTDARRGAGWGSSAAHRLLRGLPALLPFRSTRARRTSGEELSGGDRAGPGRRPGPVPTSAPGRGPSGR